ncbi:MAG: nucleotidyltransferase domain-containing protein [Spirochaetales bacterium]|nr:nucleotidyltransferase domain-containing protein [Spirochaetales bacterium]
MDKSDRDKSEVQPEGQDYSWLAQVLNNYPGALAWYLLGSAVTGTLRPDSDLDLAVLPWPGKAIDSVALVRWAGPLSLKIGRELDIGILDGSNLVYAKEALWTGRLLYCADEATERKRKAELFALYLTFQEDRREVLNAYHAR